MSALRSHSRVGALRGAAVWMQVPWWCRAAAPPVRVSWCCGAAAWMQVPWWRRAAAWMRVL